MTEKQLLPPPRARKAPDSSLSADGDSGAAHTNTSDGSDDESDGADEPAEVAQPPKGQRAGRSSAYRGVYWVYVPARAMHSRVMLYTDSCGLQTEE
jgi:hypothetical protein